VYVFTADSSKAFKRDFSGFFEMRDLFEKTSVVWYNERQETT
jgi:hypothetical protein